MSGRLGTWGLALLLTVLSGTALGYTASGWSLADSYVWRLAAEPEVRFSAGSPSRHLRPDRAIHHREGRIKVQKDIGTRYEFRVGCMIQSKIPAFELKLNPLEIRMIDQSRGFAFAHFMVDTGQEFSLRGELTPPGRIVFAPYTKAQERKLSSIFLQLREGGELKISLLQGERYYPRTFVIPLKGFVGISDQVVKDCDRLFRRGGGQLRYLPDYLTDEPSGYAPPKFSMKPIPTDGIAPDPAPEPEPEPEPAPEPEPPKEPEIIPFRPGGGIASIGPDGKPVGAAEPAVTEDEILNEDFGPAAGAMAIGDDGQPVSP